MNFGKFITLIILLITFNLSAQEELETGKHIYKDKLTYITLYENNEFQYLKYHKWSPLTLMEDQKTKKSEHQICGTIGYASGAKGKGEFEVRNGKLILKFSEFKKYMDKQTEFDEETKSMEFFITDFIN